MYTNLYEELISNAKERGWDRSAPVYVERHHIVPRSMGGTDNKDNIVFLTGSEHYMAHLYLYKIHNNYKMTHAFILMNKKHIPLDVIDPEAYEEAKIKNSKEVGDRFRGTKQSTSHVRSRIDNRIKNDPNFGIKQSEIMRTVNKNKSPEFFKKLSQRMLGENNPVHNVKRYGTNNPAFKRIYHTPNGLFSSNKLAGDYNGCSNITIINRCKKNTKGYYSIEKSNIIHIFQEIF